MTCSSPLSVTRTAALSLHCTSRNSSEIVASSTCRTPAPSAAGRRSKPNPVHLIRVIGASSSGGRRELTPVNVGTAGLCGLKCRLIITATAIAAPTPTSVTNPLVSRLMRPPRTSRCGNDRLDSVRPRSAAPPPRGDPRPSCSQDRPSTKHRGRAGARCVVILPISLPPHRHVDAHSHVVHWSRGQRERHRIPVSQLHVPCYTRQVRHHPVHPNMLRHGKLHSYLHPAAPVL